MVCTPWQSFQVANSALLRQDWWFVWYGRFLVGVRYSCNVA